ncbi:MAG: RloB domain-containing protein [Deltaproteobacteria bacterium]|nr:RloB domain-containing protein [Deltaproteobacteria bacterium]
MPRRDRQQRALRRPPGPPKKRILIVCEGKVTEREYLEAFKNWRKNPRVEIRIEGPAGVPVTLVKRAKALRDEAIALAERHDDQTYLYDEVWCVFDVDKFGELIPAARDEAQANGLKLAMSNPCIELWLILHLRDNPGQHDHHKMQAIFCALQPAVPEKHIDFAMLSPGYEEAFRRAKRLCDDATAQGEPCRNPTTEMYLLTDSIDEDGRAARKAEADRRRAEEEADSRGKAKAAAERAHAQYDAESKAADDEVKRSGE